MMKVKIHARSNNCHAKLRSINCAHGKLFTDIHDTFDVMNLAGLIFMNGLNVLVKHDPQDDNYVTIHVDDKNFGIR